MRSSESDADATDSAHIFSTFFYCKLMNSKLLPLTIALD